MSVRNPHASIADNIKQFENPKFKKFCLELVIRHFSLSSAHPQANGQVETVSKILKWASS